MPSYSIYEKPGLTAKQAIENAVLVKNQFSYLAFLLPIVWFLVKRLWIPLFAYCALLIPIAYIDASLPPLASALFTLLVALLIGLEAADLQGWMLEKKGYQHRYTLFAEDRDHCEERYIRARLEETDLSAASGHMHLKVPPRSGPNNLTGGPTGPTGLNTSKTNPQPVLGLFPDAENA